MSGGTTAATTRLRTVVFGVEGSRLRATWRFILAWPLLPLVGVIVGVVMPVLGVSGMIPGGPLQGVVFLGLLVVWARVIDRRPLLDYGVTVSRLWVLNLFVGFGVVLVVWSGWHVLIASLGLTRLELSLTAPWDSIVFRLGGTMVSLAVNSLVQDLVFFAIVLKGAAEGFHSRGVDRRRAVVGGWLVGILFFTVIHGLEGPVDVLAHAVGGAVFGALYIHTGELSLTLGVHWGSSWAAGHLFAGPAMASQFPSLFEVTILEAGIRGFWVSIPLYLATYIVLVGWLHWRRDDVLIQTSLARWTERQRGVLEMYRSPLGD